MLDPMTSTRSSEAERIRRATFGAAGIAQPPANLVATSPLNNRLPPLTPRMIIQAAVEQATTTTPTAFHTPGRQQWPASARALRVAGSRLASLF